MRFWDSSAVIPLFLKETSSELIKRLIKEDEDIVVWWMTQVECLSALSRRRREGVLSLEDEGRSRVILSALSAEWSEIQPGELVRQRAERLIMIHPLRTADAFQLSAALIWTEESPQGHTLVCLDQNLREAAQKEGFIVLPRKF